MEVKTRGNQKVLYLGDSQYSGISITINKKDKSISVSGWYDGFVGISGETIKIKDLISEFDREPRPVKE